MSGGELQTYTGDDSGELSTVPEQEGPADRAADIREIVESFKADAERGVRRGTSIEQHRARNGTAFDRRVGIPKEFSEKSQAAWANIPRSIKGDIQKLRADRDSCRAAAQSWQPLMPYAKLCASNGTDLRTALSKYNELENIFTADPVRGLSAICAMAGIDPIAAIRAWSVALSNPGWQQQQAAAPRQQQADPVEGEIEAMRRDGRFPGFDALRPRMAQLITAGHADTLQGAYYLAANERSKGSSAVARARAASKAVSGAPSSGHVPSGGGPASDSRRDLIRAAIAAQRGEV
jgi:hypothetical protein